MTHCITGHFTLGTAAAIGARRTEIVPGGAFRLELGSEYGRASIQWRKDGADIAGATGLAYAVARTTQEHAGRYSALITGPDGAQHELFAAELSLHPHLTYSP
ncbi:MAG TPA: hypothetical protein VHN79_03600 [Lacunisphaera sp.]|nr:hypothetical protein [Lacunisphaera sp.]